MRQQVPGLSPGDRRWLWWMALGARTGCHQLPERSFFLRGYQFPICARCTGVLAGYVACLVTFALYRPSLPLMALGCGVMLLDWGIQALGLRPSTQARRFFSGLAGGYGLLGIQLTVLVKLLSRLWQT